MRGLLSLIVVLTALYFGMSAKTSLESAMEARHQAFSEALGQ
jgi:hypothetical protein